MDPKDLSQFCQPGPSTSSGVDENRPSTSHMTIPFPPYLYGMDPVAGPSGSSTTPDMRPLAYPPMAVWPDSQSYPSYVSMPVNVVQPSPYISYPPPASSLRLPSTDQIPPSCLDWTINPTKAPPRQFKTTSEPLFTLGYNSTISENWMEGDKGLQYSIKNFTFSTKRTMNNNDPNGTGQVDKYDSLLISIPQVSK